MSQLQGSKQEYFNEPAVVTRGEDLTLALQACGKS